MSTKVRYVLSLGNYYKGYDAIKLLSQAGALPAIYSQRPKTPEEFAAIVKKAGGRLWIFREPRNVPYKHSRYKQLCSKLGIGRNLKLKKKVFNGTDPVIGLTPNLHQGAQHAANYAQYVLHYTPTPQQPAPGGNGFGALEEI